MSNAKQVCPETPGQFYSFCFIFQDWDRFGASSTTNCHPPPPFVPPVPCSRGVKEEAIICSQRRRQGPSLLYAMVTKRHATRLHASPLSAPRSSRQTAYFLLSRLRDLLEGTSVTRTLTHHRQHQSVHRYSAATTVWISKECFFVCACHTQQTALTFTGKVVLQASSTKCVSSQPLYIYI